MSNQATLDADGYALIRAAVDHLTIERIKQAVVSIESASAGKVASRNARGLLKSCPAVAELTANRTIRQLVEPVLGKQAFPVRAILFDKVDAANWRVGWHQDQIIPVQARVDTPSFTAWSVKQGIDHVRPPAEVLEGMLTLRVHLDDCGDDNGPLEVLPSTQKLGIVPENQVRSVAEARHPIVCTAAAGDVLMMRPLLLHASRPAKTPNHRRVVHLEFAAKPLPGELDWYRP